MRCHHICPCGSELICGDADRCPIVARQWICEACELDEQDAYFTTLLTQQETTHHEHQQRIPEQVSQSRRGRG